MFIHRFTRQVKLLASAALLTIGFAGCSGAGEEDTTDVTDAPTELDAPDPNESTAYCNGCYISFEACQQQINPGTGCTCGFGQSGDCNCSGTANPYGMTCR